MVLSRVNNGVERSHRFLSFRLCGLQLFQLLVLSTEVSQPEEVFESFRGEFLLPFSVLWAQRAGAELQCSGKAWHYHLTICGQNRGQELLPALRDCKLAWLFGEGLLASFLSEHVVAQLVPKRHRLLLNRASC